MNESGERVAEIAGVRFEFLDAGTTDRAQEHAAYEVRWQSATLPSAASTGDSGVWLLVGSDDRAFERAASRRRCGVARAIVTASTACCGDWAASSTSRERGSRVSIVRWLASRSSPVR